ncbi:histidine kinase [Nibrella saemangeumensis]|uniref:Histidine kinase n=1 Tax=Nibrella saemangeumensis TaxID=1084526 RepID=A0ABP8MDI4_9BACT
MSFSLRQHVPRFIHILGWILLGFSLFMFQPLTWQVDLPYQFWMKQIIFFSLLVGLFYLNAEVWVPKLLFQNRTSLFVGVMLAVIAVVMVLSRQVELYLNLPELMHKAFHPDGGPRFQRRGVRIDWFMLLTTTVVLGISTSIRAVQKWQKDTQIRQELEQAKVTTELSFLKAQINPHFFFNTLNNIYALTLIDTDMAREALHKLSRMMRYVLYETQNGTTLLSKELDFVEDYIQLMQLRLTEKVKVEFDKPSPLRDVPVAPMLLLPFVENAFKHGVSALHPSRIYVGVRQYNGTLDLEVRNTLFAEKTLSLDQGSGIGLANTRRRLDLLYPDNYKLAVTEMTPENEYSVRLSLHLS